MFAARNGHIEIVKYLIENGADANTALIEAAREGHIEIAKHLIENGADINAVDVLGRTALELATKRGHTETVKLLEYIENPSKAIQLSDQEKIAFEAIRKKNVLIRSLLRGDLREVKKLTKSADLPGYVLWKSPWKTIEYLLGKPFNIDKNKVLRYACQYNVENVSPMVNKLFDNPEKELRALLRNKFKRKLFTRASRKKLGQVVRGLRLIKQIKGLCPNVANEISAYINYQ